MYMEVSKWILAQRKGVSAFSHDRQGVVKGKKRVCGFSFDKKGFWEDYCLGEK
jgi:hypothetical protein